jgi:hypothetical protein
MTTIPDLVPPTAPAAPRKATSAVPRIKLSSQGVSIEHPDLDLGERLMAESFGVPDSDAMYGILRQLVRASAKGGTTDAANLAFMMSMLQSIKPRDSIEAMLVAQMVSVHVMAMRCAHQLAAARDVVQQDSASRALSRLARTFPLQIEALNRHRSQGEPVITVQNVSVADGGNAIVGNVTQHAQMLVAEPRPAAAARKPRRGRTSAPSAPEPAAVDAAQDAEA